MFQDVLEISYRYLERGIIASGWYLNHQKEVSGQDIYKTSHRHPVKFSSVLPSKVSSRCRPKISTRHPEKYFFVYLKEVTYRCRSKISTRYLSDTFKNVPRPVLNSIYNLNVTKVLIAQSIRILLQMLNVVSSNPGNDHFFQENWSRINQINELINIISQEPINSMQDHQIVSLKKHK